MLYQGDGVEQDTQYGFRFLQEAASKGHPESMHNLAAKLYFGEDETPIDREAAAGWFLQAAEADYPPAMNNIGWMLYCGDSVEEDPTRGVEWLQKAAKAG